MGRQELMGRCDLCTQRSQEDAKGLECWKILSGLGGQQ